MVKSSEIPTYNRNRAVILLIPTYAKEGPRYSIHDIHVHVIGIECDHVNCSNEINALKI